jgi:hypothetical protein
MTQEQADEVVVEAVVSIEGNQVLPLTPTIALLQTSPDAVTFHRIEDHELDALTNISRPLSLGVSTMALGTCLGPNCETY